MAQPTKERIKQVREAVKQMHMSEFTVEEFMYAYTLLIEGRLEENKFPLPTVPEAVEALERKLKRR